MTQRIETLLRIGAVAAAVLLTASCGDSGSPTEPLPPGVPPTQSPAIAGGWIGTYSGAPNACEAPAEATFNENLGSVEGQVKVSAPCGNIFLFRGTFDGSRLEGEFTDFDGFHFSGRGTVSGETLEIHLDELLTGRMNLHR